MNVLFTFKIKIESQNLDHWCIKNLWPYPNQDQDIKSLPGTSSILQSLKWGLKGHGSFWTFKTKIESQNSAHEYIKVHWPYPNQDQYAKPQAGTSSIPKSLKWGLKGHRCFLHLSDQEREPKFGCWVYLRTLTISKSRSSYQIPIRNL